MPNAAPQTVKRRRVFYIPGYDPFPPRRYRELYRKESAAQSQISGYEIAMGKPRAGSENFGWSARSTIEGHDTTAEVEILQWSDIVKSTMKTSIAATYGQWAKTAWIYVWSGALRRLMWLRKGPVIAALYPIAVLFAQLLVSWMVAATVGTLLSRWIYPGVGWIAVFPVLILCLRGWRKIDGQIYAYYLMHDYAYTAKDWGAYDPGLETRLGEFGDQIAAALDDDVDEVLIVGHSSGAHLAVSILSDLLRAGRIGNAGPKIGFLSLGHVVPMVSFLPKADRLRRDLATLAASPRIKWVDVTAPGDGCAFALCDPVDVTGVTPRNKQGPLVFSAAFTQSLSPQRWQELKRRYFRLHFQYLCAFDRPKDYDYFQITAGPIDLETRYRHRPPSKSRIDVAASPYTDMAP